jgi:hypothetical protein
MPCDFTERMERGRVLAVTRRNAGKHTGKSAKGWNAKRQEAARGTFAAARAEIRERWRCDCADAAALYAHHVFPERFWNELDGGPERTIDDAIAERLQAERDAIPF